MQHMLKALAASLLVAAPAYAQMMDVPAPVRCRRVRRLR